MSGAQQQHRHRRDGANGGRGGDRGGHSRRRPAGGQGGSIGVVVDGREVRSEFLEISSNSIDQIPFGRSFDVVTYPASHYDTPEVALDDGALKVWRSNIAQKAELRQVLQEIAREGGAGDTAICLRWIGVKATHINGNR